MRSSEGGRPRGRQLRRAGSAALVVIVMAAWGAPTAIAMPEPEFGLPVEIGAPEVVEELLPAMKINFQGEKSESVDGWWPDTGLAYDDERGYGWRSVDGAETPRRQCASRGAHPDPILDSFCHAQNRYEQSNGRWIARSVPAIWEARVADGTYAVTVTMGESRHVSSSVHNSAVVEGVVALDGFRPTWRERHRSATVIVEVVDGFVTIDPTGGTKGRIAAVEITPHVDDPLMAPDPVFVSFGSQGASPAEGWRADHGRAYSSETGFGWRALDGRVPADRQCGQRDVLGDSQLDTFCHAQTRYERGSDGAWRAVPSPAVWEAAVQNGVYDVTVVMGESEHAFSAVVNSIAVESIVVIDGFVATSEHPQANITVTVRVTDGFLTLDPSIGRNGKIAIVLIEPHIEQGNAA